MWGRFWFCITLAWLAGLSIPGMTLGAQASCRLAAPAQSKMLTVQAGRTPALPVTASQTNGEEARPSVRILPDQFIAAFELTPKGDFRFTWPPDSMRPAQYETVLLIVEKMPNAWHSKRREGQPVQLRAQDHLRVNEHPLSPFVNLAGQLQTESGNSVERFLVKLDQGRLRVRLIIPPALRVDPLHNHARIRLYSAVVRD